ncbi:MAG: hypothetical protein BGO99_06265 [Nitrosospira sp. 56-18]|nr:methyltransferase domain-containing protein [Nitrosospira sp.]OJY07977.1 MAG: hypothetical protein BGO99_06265 [Nitrosospira sp. 56-18]
MDELQRIQNIYLELMQSTLTGNIYRDESRAPFGSNIFNPQLREHGLDWPSHAQTMIGIKRLANLRALTESVITDNVPGDLIETGVWRGGACILMRAVLYAYNITDRYVWVADSFEGLPPANEQQYPADAGSDFYKYDELAVTLEQVQENFRIYSLLDEQTKFIKGWFKDTLPGAPIEQLALLRLDGDMYESTMDALTSLYPKLSPHGYVIVDDYHVVPACKSAIDDYCSANGLQPEIIEIDGVGVYWRKPPMTKHGAEIIRPSSVESPDMQIGRLNQAVIELSQNVITRLNQSVAERDAQITRLNQAAIELSQNVIIRLNQAVAERDEQLAALNQSNAKLTGKVTALLSSTSWRITKPIRETKNIINAVRSRYPPIAASRDSDQSMSKTDHHPSTQEVRLIGATSVRDRNPILSSQERSETGGRICEPVIDSMEGANMSVEKRHVYEYAVDLSGKTAPVYVMHLVGKSKRVLEVGCGPGSITKILAQEGQCRVTGLELDPEAIKKATPYCDTVMQADLNSPEWPRLLDGMERFDVVVAADVLEHLYDPWVALKRMVSFISPDGYLVISLPHVGHAAVASCLINSDFEYRDWGLLDRTHIRFFGLKNIEALFAQASLKIIEARYVIKPPEETEFATSWSRLPIAVQDALKTCACADVYQVVVKAVPLNYPGSVVALVPPKHEYNHAFTASPPSWKNRVGRYLSPQLKQRIRKNFKILGIDL